MFADCKLLSRGSSREYVEVTGIMILIVYDRELHYFYPSTIIIRRKKDETRENRISGICCTHQRDKHSIKMSW